MEDTIVYECTTDVSLIEEQLDQLILLSEQNQLFIGELHYLIGWLVAGLVGVFIISILYHLIQKFIR